MKSLLCDCGCGQSGDPRQMVPVRKTDGPPRILRGRIYRRARSWQVLPGCEQAFVLELRSAQRCLATAQLLTTLPRWRRLMRLPRLWQLRRLSLRRRLGDDKARARAWGLVLTTLLCRRLPG